MLSEALLQRGLPRDETEPHTIVDHGEPPAGELGRADDLSREIVARNGGLPCPSAFCRQCPAGALDLAAFKPLDEVFGRAEPTVAKVGDVAHLRERLLAALQRPPHRVQTRLRCAGCGWWMSVRGPARSRHRGRLVCPV